MIHDEPLIELLNDFDNYLTTMANVPLIAAEASGPIEFARAFVALREVKDRWDEVGKKFSALYEQVKTERLPAAFEAAGVPNVNLEEGYRVGVSHKLYASIKGGQREAAYAWLKENGLGDLITNTVNASTLSAAAKTMQEENVELPEELFNVAIIPNTSVTKTK